MDVARTQDRMTHDLWLPEETVAVRAEARRSVEAHVAPNAREIGETEESADSFPWATFRGLADDGMFAVPFPKTFGRGLEFPMLGTCTVAEEIAYHSSSMAGVYDGQCILVPQALSFALPEVQAELIPQLVSGETAFAFATSEPDASSDLRPSTIRTIAAAVEGGYAVTGRKRWITNSIVADWVTMLCGYEDRMIMLLINLKAPGVRVGKPDLKMGHRGQLTSDIVLENVFVPHEHVLGEPGRGLAVALSCLVRGRIGIAAAGVGVAQGALDLAVHRLRERHVLDRPLGAMQYWQFKMAERATEIECSRSLYQKAATLLDHGDQSAEPEAAMAKAYSTRVAVDTVRDAIQIWGALGFSREVSESGESVRLEQMYRDAKVLEIFEGANELQQWIVARQLIGRDVTS